MRLGNIFYSKLTSKQKETYNYARLSMELARLGLLATRLHDGWEDAEGKTNGSGVFPDREGKRWGRCLTLHLGAGLGLRADVAGGAGPRRGSAEKERGH